MSKEGKKFLKFITSKAQNRAKKKMKQEGPIMVYRDAAAEQYSNWSKPDGIAVTVESGVATIDIFTKAGTVQGVQHKDLQELDFDNPDKGLAKTILDACIDALAGHYASKNKKVWNLGHNVDKWPEEVMQIAVDAVFANTNDMAEVEDIDNADIEQLAQDIMVPNYDKAFKELEALNVDIESFGYRFFQLVHFMTFADHAEPDESIKGLKARMKEVEMEEHGHRFAPPQGTTMH